MQPDPSSVALSSRVACALAIAVAGIGTFTLAAWLLAPDLRADVVVSSMKVNTALALVCAAASIYLVAGARPRPHAAQWLAIAVIAIAVATLGEYLLGRALGIDQLLVADPTRTRFPGRMGANTAAMLGLVGTSLLLQARHGGRAGRAADGLALVAAMIAILALVGFIFGSAPLTGLATHAEMAPHAALAGLSLCAAAALLRREGGTAALLASTGTGGFAARRLIPVAIVVPLLTGWLTFLGVGAGTYDAALGAALAVLASMVVLGVVAVMSARSLDNLDRDRRRATEEIRRLGLALAARAAELEVSNRELEAFSYSVSHDLRAPIRHIGGFAELLEARSADLLDDKARHYVDTISQAAHRAGRLIDDLLAFSRMGRAEMKQVRVDLAACAAEVWRDMAPDRRGRNVDLVVGEVPPVSGDPELLRCVIENLLGNALKYTAPRDAAVIEIAGRQEGTEVVVSVRDNGVGFDNRYAGKLFGVFQRLHTQEAFDGCGIGLASVRRIVQRHGGRVSAEGEIDRGATFHVTLPGFIEPEVAR